ncbi:MAG: CoA ester lyase [Deltaproteobacteria bacterium]|nr:CoA ester lyase [Deltaproteobacteria bacterium]
MATPAADSLRSRRSLLFVPGAEPRKLERAREAVADVVLLDLEDSVAPPQKEEARSLVADTIRAGGFVGEAAVRLNAPDTAYFEADLAAVLGAGARTVMIPKSESPETLAEVARAAARLAGGECVDLLALVETPLGIARALDVARAGVAALCFGHADFALQMGLGEADASRGVVYHARCNLVIAARAGGVTPIDSVYLAVKDDDGFRAETDAGRMLGFEGKLCIHPRQVEIANEVYTPGPAEIDKAKRVLEAWRSRDRGSAVLTVDGKMVDAPLVAVQERVLERARRAGVA